MIQNPGYMLKELAGVPYLLPYGQMIADHRRGMKINGTGVYLWNLFATPHSLDEVLTLAKEYYQVDTLSYPTFEQEIKQFINILLTHGILLKKSPATDSVQNADLASIVVPPSVYDEKYMSIGKLQLRLINFCDAYPKQFDSFLTKQPADIHQTITFHPEKAPTHVKEHILLQNYELNIEELENAYVLTLPQTPQIYEMHLSKDGMYVHIYGTPPYTDTFYEDMFHAIRLPFLYLAQMHNMVALHSASIEYKGKAWMFSGPSGTGKSTHTNLWKEYLNTAMINGDLNLLAFEQGIPVIHGIPWCGTSGIYNTKTYPLGGIVLLKQAPWDYITELSTDEKQLLVSQRFISPSWTKMLFENNLELAGKITEKIMVCRLHCTKEKTAMNTIQKHIDKYLEDAR